MVPSTSAYEASRPCSAKQLRSRTPPTRTARQWCVSTSTIGVAFFAALAPSLQVGEQRRLAHAEADLDADDDQHGADQEWDAPAPGQEVGIGHAAEERQDHRRYDRATRRAHIDERGGEPTFALSAVSTLIVAEPPQSPPTAIPCRMRSPTSMIGAQTPH